MHTLYWMQSISWEYFTLKTIDILSGTAFAIYIFFSLLRDLRAFCSILEILCCPQGVEKPLKIARETGEFHHTCMGVLKLLIIFFAFVGKGLLCLKVWKLTPLIITGCPSFEKTIFLYLHIPLFMWIILPKVGQCLKEFQEIERCWEKMQRTAARNRFPSTYEELNHKASDTWWFFDCKRVFNSHCERQR